MCRTDRFLAIGRRSRLGTEQRLGERTIQGTDIITPRTVSDTAMVGIIIENLRGSNQISCHRITARQWPTAWTSSAYPYQSSVVIKKIIREPVVILFSARASV